MQRKVFSQKYFSIPDLVILMLVATTIYGMFAIAHEWRAEFRPVTKIDLSAWALPYYTLLSGIRGAAAYLISLCFTIVVGYTAAKSKPAEKVIIPLLDILQSIPVLGFLPGLLLSLVALFPHTNTGLELTAIIMIFTGQVWNMTFSFYTSLKSIPSDLQEASTVIGLNWRDKLKKVEMPYSALNLAWNSLLSMAGGWFFLIPCEAITLGDREYRLPGIGSYMFEAISKGDNEAIVLAVIAMTFLIVSMDFVIWRPILSWVRKFRLEDITGAPTAEPLMQIWLRESKIIRSLKLFYRNFIFKYQYQPSPVLHSEVIVDVLSGKKGPQFYGVIFGWFKKGPPQGVLKSLQVLMGVSAFIFVAYGAYKLTTVLIQVPVSTWLDLLRDTFWTFGRVVLALLISTLWAVPVGIWIGTSAKRIQIAQPMIQVLASFPAPMLYPLALGLFFALKISFDWAAMFLMLLGVQWYVLFNVLAGALRIPQELGYALALMETPRWERWRRLYLPSVFPSLVTGWITAAGGAWNASVVAEYITYKNTILKTNGLGAALSVATANENFRVFAASLTLMVFVVIMLNRFVWSRILAIAQTRYRMDT